MRTDVIKGEIIDIEKDTVPHAVVVNCMIMEEPKKTFQMRRFSAEVLEGAVPLVVGTYLAITMTVEPGKMTYTFEPIYEDLSEYFEQKDLFSKYKNSAFIGNHDSSRV